ncbi:hypothetical protein SCHPADRAFT_891852 [Schizopora paradoxa]|uniref:Uncharacterized protein n=1 Tax=Schizopora paradoxa TaxID=27342 RepID=A0A0H2S2A9_9AGAM|nr:hypothetical protein SCHPADRAFT_891852 [Schizopora paradoxa]
MRRNWKGWMELRLFKARSRNRGSGSAGSCVPQDDGTPRGEGDQNVWIGSDDGVAKPLDVRASRSTSPRISAPSPDIARNLQNDNLIQALITCLPSQSRRSNISQDLHLQNEIRMPGAGRRAIDTGRGGQLACMRMRAGVSNWGTRGRRPRCAGGGTPDARFPQLYIPLLAPRRTPKDTFTLPIPSIHPPVNSFIRSFNHSSSAVPPPFPPPQSFVEEDSIASESLLGTRERHDAVDLSPKHRERVVGSLTCQGLGNPSVGSLFRFDFCLNIPPTFAGAPRISRTQEPFVSRREFEGMLFDSGSNIYTNLKRFRPQNSVKPAGTVWRPCQNVESRTKRRTRRGSRLTDVVVCVVPKKTRLPRVKDGYVVSASFATEHQEPNQSTVKSFQELVAFNSDVTYKLFKCEY